MELQLLILRFFMIKFIHKNTTCIICNVDEGPAVQDLIQLPEEEILGQEFLEQDSPSSTNTQEQVSPDGELPGQSPDTSTQELDNV